MSHLASGDLFLTDEILGENFAYSSAESMFSEIDLLLKKERWQTPSIKTGERLWILENLQFLLPNSSQVYRLNQCDYYNAQDWSQRQFSHEWSHILREFHEFCIILPPQHDAAGGNNEGALALLNIVYE